VSIVGLLDTKLHLDLLPLLSRHRVMVMGIYPSDHLILQVLGQTIVAQDGRAGVRLRLRRKPIMGVGVYCFIREVRGQTVIHAVRALRSDRITLCDLRASHITDIV
jgi:hypothetical protein